MLAILGYVAVPECVDLVDLIKGFPTSIYLQTSASIQPRTSPSKFGGKYSLLFTSLLSPGEVGVRLAREGRGPEAERRRARQGAELARLPGRHPFQAALRSGLRSRRGMRQTLEGSFSAVSMPNFARKY